MLTSGEFRKFDFGSEELNMQKYGQPTPPAYNLTNIDIPVNLFIGMSDKLADPTDAKRLIDELKGSPDVFYKFMDSGHGTFLWGKNMTFLAEVEQRLNA